ncbi:MAG TPA: HAD-IB family phosphatase [Candidatus Limnocylindria bacterium]|nr:HAD-IB family phosphatase [Candidatus Limnocylindria bacterium]
MPTAFLCDFDGTISPSDIGAAFVRNFSPGRDAERAALLERWRSGRLGSREITEAECALMRTSRSDALAFTRRFDLDPWFAPFVAEALDRGDQVMVVSEGFDFYVNDQLARHGLERLPVAANHIRFAGDRVIPEFPFSDPECASCGNCKAAHVRRYRALGERTVLVGDGLSDRCGARAAEVVLARAGSDLEGWCRAASIPCTPFTSFAEVAALARVTPTARRVAGG